MQNVRFLTRRKPDPGESTPRLRIAITPNPGAVSSTRRTASRVQNARGTTRPAASPDAYAEVVKLYQRAHHVSPSFAVIIRYETESGFSQHQSDPMPRDKALRELRRLQARDVDAWVQDIVTGETIR
jgi:hypothetical protein